SPFVAFGRNVVAQPHLSVQLGSSRACLLEFDGTGIAQCDSALLRADLELKDEGTTPSCTQSQSKAGQGLVEDNDLGPACGQCQSVDYPVCEFHVRASSRFWEDPGKITHASSRELLLSMGR